jgi:putative tryptophan/tyrosine transport system substrate-binding protein
MARELIDGKVDIIVIVTTPAALAAKQATSVLPIVFVEVGNPILVGLVGSLSRPEANITGFSNMASDLRQTLRAPQGGNPARQAYCSLVESK